VAEISYSGAAIKDLEQIGDYIAGQFKSFGVALDTVNKIQGRINTLADFPLIGAPLSSIYEIITDYRFLICGNYLAFYRTDGNSVLVDRILYSKRDYLAILFGDLPQGKTE
jgi:plasmid stabilization system protein ParE